MRHCGPHESGPFRDWLREQMLAQQLTAARRRQAYRPRRGDHPRLVWHIEHVGIALTGNPRLVPSGTRTRLSPSASDAEHPATTTTSAATSSSSPHNPQAASNRQPSDAPHSCSRTGGQSAPEMNGASHRLCGHAPIVLVCAGLRDRCRRLTASCTPLPHPLVRSGWPDSNRRPPRPKRGALPG
jgi:hypothetical protein